MEKFSDLIRTRRSMRKFTSEELTQEEVVSLLKAALMAPTSKRSNSWQFIAVLRTDGMKNILVYGIACFQKRCRVMGGRSVHEY